jgi:hypothetical protein
MKKTLLLFGFSLLSASLVMAQDKASKKGASQPATAAKQAAAAQIAPEASKTLTPENLSFKADSHDFGTIQEGPNADFEYVFTNTSREPIIIQKVQASCGCTTPSYISEPVLPGKTGYIKASYHTQGRPGAFTKTLTVESNAGTKVLSLKGTVEKAPASSVPENGSMMKTN